MRVVIDTLPNERGGGITYLKNMLPRFGETEDEYRVLVPEGRGALGESQPENVELVAVRFPTDSLVLRMVYQQLVLPFVLLWMDADVLYSPADITTFLAPCPTVVAFRNSNPYFEQGNRSFGERLRFLVQRWLSRLSALRSAALIFVSHFSKERMNEFLRAAERKCRVIYHGIDASVFESPREPDDWSLTETVTDREPYVLCVSTIYKHKNYETLLKGYAALPADLRAAYPLVVAGGHTDDEYFASIRALTRAEGIEDDVCFLGKVDYEVVPYLYAHAAVSVLPSKLETFGHTLIESMAAGVPVVAADSTCIPEVTDGAALLFDPDDHEQLATYLEEVLTDDETAARLAKAGDRRVRDFSWDRTARDTHETLRNVVRE